MVLWGLEYILFWVHGPLGRALQLCNLPPQGSSSRNAQILFVAPALLLILTQTLALRLKLAQKPYIVWPLGPKALTYESLGL